MAPLLQEGVIARLLGGLTLTNFWWPYLWHSTLLFSLDFYDINNKVDFMQFFAVYLEVVRCYASAGAALCGVLWYF